MLSNSTEVAPPAPRKPLLASCLGCRVLSGLALMGSGLWVYLGSRRVMLQKIPPNTWHIIQMAFAVGLFSWGAIVMLEPVRKLKRNED